MLRRHDHRRPHGALWFTEQSANKIGRISTAGSVVEFALPTASSGPSGTAVGPDGALWVTEYNANKIAVLPSVFCGVGPRPPVQISTQQSAANTMQVTITATTNTGTPNNAISAVVLANDAHVSNPNALVDVPGGSDGRAGAAHDHASQRDHECDLHRTRRDNWPAGYGTAYRCGRLRPLADVGR